ncbi:MAG TPA: tetratricopeptide repeat protein, partial [Pirellulaceae bacterium]|nr:tetratricopeptide repeat protein [Pirellulaceae bacterium]
MLRRWTFSFSIAGVLCSALGGFAAEVVAPLPGLAQEGDDPPALHTPARQRGEIDQDRIAASAIFAHGRLLYQREDLVGALRRYERAYRYDPDAAVVLDAIVPLAFELEHNEEAARYAVIAAEKNPQDPLLLRRLAMHLTEQQEYARALKLYQKSFELQKDADDVTSILLHMEIGRLNFLEGDFGPAAESFARVRDAIVDPKKFELSAEMQKIVLGNAPTTYTLLGESFFQADKLDDAEAMFRKANEAKPDAPRLAFLLARIRAKQKRFDDALNELDLYFKAKAAGSGAE